jgi:hypothetical protein
MQFRQMLIAAAALAAVVPAGASVRPSLFAARVHADSGAWATFTPLYGQPQQSRLFSFAGFSPGEVIDLSFQTPDGQAASVGNGTAFQASAQDDGTGNFNFQPSDWLSSPQSGRWTVTVLGETSGYTFTASLYLQGDDD